jgi:hypothetical protein
MECAQAQHRYETPLYLSRIYRKGCSLANVRNGANNCSFRQPVKEPSGIVRERMCRECRIPTRRRSHPRIVTHSLKDLFSLLKKPSSVFSSSFFDDDRHRRVFSPTPSTNSIRRPHSDCSRRSVVTNKTHHDVGAGSYVITALLQMGHDATTVSHLSIHSAWKEWG